MKKFLCMRCFPYEASLLTQENGKLGIVLWNQTGRTSLKRSVFWTCLWEQEILDSFQDTGFWYAEQGSVSSNPKLPGSFRRFVHHEEKWWLPVPCVPPEGLSGSSRKRLQQKRDCTNQIHKAAMAINSSVLDEMDIPQSYMESLPKVSSLSTGRSITALPAWTSEFGYGKRFPVLFCFLGSGRWEQFSSFPRNSLKIMLQFTLLKISLCDPTFSYWAVPVPGACSDQFRGWASFEPNGPTKFELEPAKRKNWIALNQLC